MDDRLIFVQIPSIVVAISKRTLVSKTHISGMNWVKYFLEKYTYSQKKLSANRKYLFQCFALFSYSFICLLSQFHNFTSKCNIAILQSWRPRVIRFNILNSHGLLMSEMVAFKTDSRELLIGVRVFSSEHAHFEKCRPRNLMSVLRTENSYS